MAVPSLSDALAELQSPSSPTTQVAALKHLRNTIIGNAGRKESAIHHGILDTLSQVIASVTRGHGKQKPNEHANGASTAASPEAIWTDHHEVCLQALTLVDLLAHGGVAYIYPIKAAGVVPHIAACLSPAENPPRIVHAALKTLVTVYDTATQASESTVIPEPWDQLPFETLLDSFVVILAQTTTNKFVHDQIALTARLVDRTTTSERQRSACVQAGVLDLLAARLVAYYEKQGLPPHKSSPASRACRFQAPSPQALADILHTITSLVKGSKYRIVRLLYSPVVLSILPWIRYGPGGDMSPGQVALSHAHPVDAFLPKVQPVDRSDKVFQKSFPPLGSADRSKSSALLDLATSGSNTPAGADDGRRWQSTMSSWLMVTLRTERGLCRAEAASLLTTTARHGFFDKKRERQLALFVVPLLVNLVEDHSVQNGKGSILAPSADRDRAKLRVLAPEVLAFLIKDSPRLQEAAIDCGIIPRVAALLKSTFGYIEAQTPIWYPTSTSGPQDMTESRTLGPSDVRPDILQTMKVRAAALILVAALADKEEKYRKQIVDAGIVPMIVQALTPLNKTALDEVCKASKREKLDETFGNTVSVLVAGCNAARALSRSISLLRTSMIDHNVGKPIFELLKHPDVSVLISATDVICNLILEMSPTRTDLVEWGVIRILCDHAHSADSRIRLVSLWALKHLIHKAPKDVRERCLEDLGTGWLLQIITGGSASATAKPSTPLYSANAAGERVDLLNSQEEMDTDQSQLPTGDEDSSIDIPPIYDTDADLLLSAQHWRFLLQDVRKIEERDNAAKAQKDEIQIQAQGLDFIRNLIVDHDPRPVMIEVLFQYIGAAKIFEIVASKLRPTTAPFDSLGQQYFGPIEIIRPSVYILIHIAAGLPKHRQQLMAQHNVLKLLIPLMRHPDQEIRVSCVWCIINLTWADDQADTPAARQRAYDLRALGFEEPLRQLEKDTVLDVREKAGVALTSIKEAINADASGRHRSGSAGRRSFPSQPSPSA